MAAIPRSYKKNIAEGKGILFFSIIFGLFIRLSYLLYFDNLQQPIASGYLWDVIAPFFSNKIISVVCSGLFTAGMAFLAANINTTHVLIRERTILPPAMIILLFSCHPRFIFMSAEYITAILILYIIYILFASYHGNKPQIASFQTGFMLALASMFTPVAIIYFPLLWVSLAMMRSINFRGLLSSIFGIVLIYAPALSFYLLTDNLQAFLKPFSSVELSALSDMALLKFDIAQWVILGIVILMLIIIISDNYLNRHKDKIKIRAYLGVLTIFTVLSLLAYLLLNISPATHLYISLATGSLLLSHFFALVEKKANVIFFYILIVIYIVFCLMPFLLF